MALPCWIGDGEIRLSLFPAYEMPQILPHLVPLREAAAARQAKFATGSLWVSILRDADWVFWTRTVLRDKATPMRSFIGGGVRSRIMARLPEWCDEAALAHWAQESSEPPSWPEAHRRLQPVGSAWDLFSRPCQCGLASQRMGFSQSYRRRRRKGALGRAIQPAIAPTNTRHGSMRYCMTGCRFVLEP